jgi:hypothetical protein
VSAEWAASARVREVGLVLGVVAVRAAPAGLAEPVVLAQVSAVGGRAAPAEVGVLALAQEEAQPGVE